jgi:gliding motility-associated-like protein
MIGRAEVASTLYPEIANGDNKITLKFRKNVPWLNSSYVVYRFNEGSGLYDSIATTSDDTYTDAGLLNGNTYCYFIKSKGSRFIDGVEYFTENLSHEACGTPGDTIPPCPPQLTVSSNCDLLYNELDWSYRVQDAECSEDVVKYYIYYTPSLSQEMTVIDSLNGRDNTFYRHYPADALAACYYVTAIDSFGNESIPSIKFCIDNCANYELPNVFTPNNDQKNDILKPVKNQDVESIDLKIFNRWGQVVFETKDPEINWDGKFKDTDDLVSPGVYYYICDVYEYRLTGIEVRNMVGFVHVYHEKGAINTFNDETEL